MPARRPARDTVSSLRGRITDLHCQLDHLYHERAAEQARHQALERQCQAMAGLLRAAADLLAPPAIAGPRHDDDDIPF